MAKFSFEVSNLPNFLNLSSRVENAIVEGLDELGDDLQLIAQKSAPVDTGDLERSIERSPVNKSKMTVEVSASAMNRGFNYARKMDKEQYNLGSESVGKQASGSIKSKYTGVKYTVGTGYLTGSAKRSKRGYTKHIRTKVSKQLKLF